MLDRMSVKGDSTISEIFCYFPIFFGCITFRRILSPHLLNLKALIEKIFWKRWFFSISVNFSFFFHFLLLSFLSFFYSFIGSLPPCLLSSSREVVGRNFLSFYKKNILSYRTILGKSRINPPSSFRDSHDSKVKIPDDPKSRR